MLTVTGGDHLKRLTVGVLWLLSRSSISSYWA